MQQTGFGDFLGASFEGIKDDLGYVLAWVAAVALVGVVSDVALPTENGLAVAGTIASLMVTLSGQSHLIRRYLERHHIISAEDARQPRLGSIFGISLLVGIASLAGILLLVIPGIFLASRWFASVPALFARQSNATDAMRGSWSITEGHVLAIFGTMLVLMLPAIFGIATLFATADDEVISVGESLALNIPIALSTAALWVSAAAIFARLDGGLERRADIFA